MSEFSLQMVLDSVDLAECPAIRDVLVQRWKYSHYIHGCVAWAHGLGCGCSVEQVAAVSVALELAWAAVLVLDDILDEDDMRFHAPAAWKTEGTGVAAMEASAALVKSMAILSSWPDVQKAFALSLEETESVSRRLRMIGFDVTVAEIEPLVRKLGSLSAFAASWACPDSGLGILAEYETCAGQLVNDCNDCFGKKALRRNFPDLRTRQPTLLSQLVCEGDSSVDWACRYQSVSLEMCGEMSREIQALIRKNESIVFRYYDSCFFRARQELEALTGVPDAERCGAEARLTRNGETWRRKLQQIIWE